MGRPRKQPTNEPSKPQTEEITTQKQIEQDKFAEIYSQFSSKPMSEGLKKTVEKAKVRIPDKSKLGELVIDDDFVKAPRKVVEPITKREEEQQVEEDTLTLTPKEQRELDISTWGTGFTADEYRVMNRKLEEFKKYYPIRTAMHKEALVTYIKLAQKRDVAIASGDEEGAERWGKLASTQAKDAKINPNQLSIADLSNGITSLGKIVEDVEKVDDVIPILPRYLARPQDEVDYAIWLMIQYCQRLKGVPECKYSDIYQFVVEKYNQNKEKYKFLRPTIDKKYDEKGKV